MPTTPTSTPIDVVRDVHTRHCCDRHGCKYAKDECTVTTGTAPQEYPCESCGYEDEQVAELVADKPLLERTLRAAADRHGIAWVAQAAGLDARNSDA